MGLAIELGLMALAAVATIAVGIYNSCNSSSKVSMPELNIADKFEAKKKNIKTDLILELFKGIVTIQARIQAREAAKQELLNSIGSASGAMSALCISATINVVQDNIAELQGENSQVNQTTAVKTQEGAYVETFPVTQQQGAQIYDTPAGQIEGPLINVFPWVQPEPKVYETPKDNMDIPLINIFPEAKAKESEDSILWMGGNGGTGKADVVEVEISRSKYPESAKHIEDAIANGQPDVLTINRAGAKPNRKASLKGIDKVPGKDLDEYPPAMFEEGGEGASVRPINPSDNRGSGSTAGHKLRPYSDGTKIKYKITDD